MNDLVMALGGVVVLAALAVLTGGWRRGLAPWTIATSKMTVAQLGLRVTDPEDVRRVNEILSSFAGGFNRTLTGPSPRAAQHYCKSLSPLYRPFAEEGAAMGYTPRRMFRYDPADFESRVVRPSPEFRYLYYVGLGFWSGMRNHAPMRLERIVEGLDPLHRYLCFDGYGFKRAFFDFPHDPAGLDVLTSLNGYARNAAYQGVGRALYFWSMNQPAALMEKIGALEAYADDAAAGVGLAASFVNPDRLDRAFSLGRLMPENWRPHFHLGMCFGLKARSINDQDAFDGFLESQPPAVQGAIRMSIRECDRVELLVRADGQTDGYRRWRERVTQWLTAHIEYPMQRPSQVHSSPATGTFHPDEKKRALPAGF